MCATAFVLVFPYLGVISVASMDLLISSQSPHQPSFVHRRRLACSSLVGQYGRSQPTRRVAAPYLVVRFGSPREGIPPSPEDTRPHSHRRANTRESWQSCPSSGKTVVSHRHSYTLSLSPYIWPSCPCDRWALAPRPQCGWRRPSSADRGPADKIIGRYCPVAAGLGRVVCLIGYSKQGQHRGLVQSTPSLESEASVSPNSGVTVRSTEIQQEHDESQVFIETCLVKQWSSVVR